MAPFAKGACVSGRTYTNERRDNPAEKAAHTGRRVDVPDRVRHPAETTLRREQRIRLHVRLNHIDRIHSQPQNQTRCRAGQKRHRRRKLRAVLEMLLLHGLLDDVVIRQEVNAHTVALTDQRRREATEYTRNATLSFHPGVSESRTGAGSRMDPSRSQSAASADGYGHAQ